MKYESNIYLSVKLAKIKKNVISSVAKGQEAGILNCLGRRPKLVQLF